MELPYEPTYFQQLNRAERRRLAKASRHRGTDIRKWQHQLPKPPTQSVAAMTCGTCRHPVPECICLDAKGQPLNWGPARPPMRIDYGGSVS